MGSTRSILNSTTARESRGWGGGSYTPEYSSMRLPRGEFEPGDCTTALHEFGHALGLYHEFENPDSLKHLRPITTETYQKLEDTYGWSKRKRM